MSKNVDWENRTGDASRGQSAPAGRDVPLPQAGYQRRFSDLLNRTEFEYIPLTNLELTFHGDGSTISRPFVALNKRHVRLCYELEE